MGFGLFGKRGNLQRLGSEEVIDVEALGRRTVHLDKKKGDLGLTLGNTQDGSGVLIVACEAGSLSALAGLLKGDIIFKVNEHDVGTHAEAVSLMDKAAKGQVYLQLGTMQADVDIVSSIPTFNRSQSSKSVGVADGD